jgi:hypothetical protein
VAVRCLTKEESLQWRRDHARRREWKRQFTCVTPLKDLPWFARELTDSARDFRAALLLVDIILGTATIEAWRRSLGEERPLGEVPGHLFEANPDELSAGLAAALADTVDVTVLLHPARLAIVADHDEYTTVFSPSPLGRLKERLTGRGVRLVDYHRTAP